VLTYSSISCCRESLYEDEGFDQRQLAGLVASKVNFLVQNACNCWCSNLIACMHFLAPLLLWGLYVASVVSLIGFLLPW
jgi:hypothetical protein